MLSKNIILLVLSLFSLTLFAAAGDKASDFTLPDLNVNRVSLSDYKGKVILLNFFATWCPPCRNEIPDLNKLYHNYQSQGFVILGVSDESAADLKAFTSSTTIDYPILVDDGGKIYSQYLNYLPADERGYVPTTFIINPEGEIIKGFAGSLDYEGFEALIKPLIKPGEHNVGSSAAPDFSLLDISSNKHILSDYSGKVIILDFWATWCPPCRMEIPHFNELQAQYGKKGLQIIGISVDKGGKSDIVDFLKDNDIDYPILLAENSTKEAYQSLLPSDKQGYIPYTFIIDRKGKIVKWFVGYNDKETFEKLIIPLLD